ncbi:hypothetical protein C9374_003304 [Naegleria lovaniensis]|uniref:USP domain-containing protein n=1 Tax=Naegleria lovaniensis TaxID=51637 RepID=A0AA88GTF2_NAELO|nr:uncharacterized protein C9374_003304 [Naegleria lovaniensis]KAG2385489.1 hypothetical protein C9374_003304 [Naegleria lovaniensis]
MSELFGDMFAQDQELLPQGSSSTNGGTSKEGRNYNQLLSSLDNLKRQASNFVGLRNQASTCYLNSLIQTLYMIPQMRANFLNLDLAKYYERSSGSSSSSKPSVDEYEDVEIDFSTFPFYSQLLDMGFESTLINKAFHKFVEPTDTSDTEVSNRVQESMILWLFEEQERQQTAAFSDNSSLVAFDNSDGAVMGSLFDNIPVIDETVTSHISTNSKKIIKKKKAKKQKQPNLLFVMQKLFSYMAKIEKPSIETVELTDAFGWKSRHVSMQHDIQELSRVFFQALETKLSKMKIDNFIKNTCAGKIVNKIVCQECGNVSCVEEEFYDLTITVENSLKESLEKYTEVERFEGNNKYHCSNCKKCVELALRNTTIRQLPPILFFSLTRFSYDWNTESRIKVKKEMAFEASLDMTPFTENPSTTDRDEYELVSVIIHSGSPYAGHYYCLARDFLGEGKTTIEDEESNKNEKKNKKKASSIFQVSDDQHWFEFNDERVYQVDAKDEIPKYFGGKGASAYMLVYKKKSLSDTIINFSLPPYFEQEIDKENDHIQILRDYQTQQNDMNRQANLEKQNTGSALVYLPRFFSVEDASLVPSNFDEIGKLYRTFSFHYDTSLNDFYGLVQEKFADSFDNFTLYTMEKDGNKYVIGSELPKHADDDEILIRQYCKQDSKYMYILVDSQTMSPTDNRFQIQKSTSSTEITLYESFCDTKIVKLEFNISTTLRELIDQAKERFSCELPLRVFFNYTKGKPQRISNLDAKMLCYLNGFTSISLEHETNDISYVETLYEEAQVLAQLVTNQTNDSFKRTDDDRGDLVIVKFADREKLIHIDLSSSLFLLKKKILHEMFSTNIKILDKLSAEGDVWIRKCVLIRKQKKSFIEEKDNDSPLTKLDIGDGDRLDVVIHLQSEKEVEIQFIEIVPQDPNYDEKNEAVTFNTRNTFLMKLEQDMSLKQCKTKLSQRFKKDDWEYDNIHNFRFRSSQNGHSGQVIKDEDTLLSTLLIEQNDNVLFVELGRAPIIGQVKVLVNLVKDQFPPKTPSDKILNENEEYLEQCATLTVSENCTLAFFKQCLLKRVITFKDISSIAQLQIRDCSFSAGFKRMTKVYSDTFHLNKTLDKLRWKDTKVIAVKILNESEIRKNHELQQQQQDEPSQTTKKRDKTKGKKKIIPPPVHVIVRTREKSPTGSQFLYSAAKELVIEAPTISKWDHLEAFKKGILEMADLSFNENEVIISKYSFNDTRIIRIDELDETTSNETTQTTSIEDSTQKVTSSQDTITNKEKEKEIHLMKRINISDGDVLIVSLKSDLDKDEIMKNFSTSLKDFEKEKSSSGKRGSEDDFFGFVLSKGSRVKEEALQIFLDDSDEEEDD